MIRVCSKMGVWVVYSQDDVPASVPVEVAGVRDTVNGLF